MPQFLLDPADLETGGRAAVLRGAEAHHLVRVLRARPGQRVLLFDGAGRRWEGSLADWGRAEARVEDLQALPPNEGALRLVLAQSLPKGERWSWILEKGTELGVTRFAPLRSRRTVAAEGGSTRRSRWTSLAVAAAKQCERALVPSVEEPADLAPFLRSLGPPRDAEVRLVCTERSAAAEPHFAERPQEVTVAVGPEGGWAPEEVEAFAESGFRPLSLGPRVLRADTAALASLVWVQTRWGDLVAPAHP